MGRLGYFTNKIDRKNLEPGDHIYSYRAGYSFSHHGIFIGEDRVIHYNKTQGGTWLASSQSTSREAKPCQNCGVNPNQRHGVVKTCIDCFLRGHTLRLYRYGVSCTRYLKDKMGTCTPTDRAYKPDVIVSHANDLLRDGYGEYNVHTNNCETFATFCTTGKHISQQILLRYLGYLSLRKWILNEIKENEMRKRKAAESGLILAKNGRMQVTGGLLKG